MKTAMATSVRSQLRLFLFTAGLVLLPASLPAQDEAVELDAALAAELAAVDEQVERDLRTRFAAIPGMTGIEVNSEGGLITLSGRVANLELIELAATVAERQDDVLQVDNRLSVSTDVAERFTPLIESVRDRSWQLYDALPLLVAALLIILFSLWFGRWLSERKFIERRTQQQPFIIHLLRQAIRLITLGVGLLVALDLLGATALLGALLGTAGVAGIAFGFAFRDVAENYIAGILLSLRQPFSPKDFVVVDGHQGVVARLNSRATILLTPDGNHLRLPNALVFKAVIVNYSRNPTRRFEFDLGLATDTDLDQACLLAEQTLTSLPDVLDDPAPQAFIAEAGDSTIVLRFQGWVDQRKTDFLKLRSEALRLVMIAFDEARIEMPDPGLRVNLGERTNETELDAAKQDRPAAGAARSSNAPQRDVSPDHSVERAVDEERAKSDKDLLSRRAPQE